MNYRKEKIRMKKFLALVLMACMMVTFAAAEEILPPKMIAATIYDAQGVIVEKCEDGCIAVADEPIAPMDLAALGLDSMAKFETFVVKAEEGKLVDGS